MANLAVYFYRHVRQVRNGNRSTDMKLYLKNEQEIEKLLEKVIPDVAAGKYAPAFARLKVHWPFPIEEMDRLERETVQKLPYAGQRFGKVLGHEFVRVKKAKDFALRYYYVIRHEYHVIRLMASFYRSEGGWVLSGFTWDDVLDDLWDDPQG